MVWSIGKAIIYSSVSTTVDWSAIQRAAANAAEAGVTVGKGAKSKAMTVAQAEEKPKPGNNNNNSTPIPVQNPPKKTY